MRSTARSVALPPVPRRPRAPRLRVEKLAITTEACLGAVGPRSQTLYRRELHRFLSHVPLADVPRLSPADVAKYLASLQRAGLGPSSRALALSAVRSWLASLVRTELLPRNPATGLRVRVRESDQRRAVALGWSEVSRLLAPDGKKLADLRDRALLMIGFTLGLRVSELRRLRVRDLHLKPAHGTLTVVGSKGGRRQVRFVNQAAAQALRVYLRRRGSVAGEAALFGRHAPAAAQGAGLGSHAVAAILRRRCAAVGLTDRLTPQGMRLTYIRLAADAGAPVHRIQRTVGHANVGTTWKYVASWAVGNDLSRVFSGGKFA